MSVEILYESERRLRELTSSEKAITNNGIEVGSGTEAVFTLGRASI